MGTCTFSFEGWSLLLCDLY
uniref:Uncharacterized protein n=1 Tax=Arundo donax TaxID=35708 RepID=A0A0A9GHN7_ARUDO